MRDVRLERARTASTSPARSRRATRRLFGKEVIASPVIAAGTGLVGAFGQGATITIARKPGVTFTESGLGDSVGQELFTRNQVRFRGEERIALVVERPAAFTKVTNLCPR